MDGLEWAWQDLGQSQPDVLKDSSFLLPNSDGEPPQAKELDASHFRIKDGGNST